jgi:hypothetical protein
LASAKFQRHSFVFATIPKLGIIRRTKASKIARHSETPTSQDKVAKVFLCNLDCFDTRNEQLLISFNAQTPPP